MTEEHDKILKTGETCWRLEKADHMSVLTDGAPYYGVLRECLKKARDTVFIVGWDVDSRTRLVGPSGDTGDDLPDRLGPFLTSLVEKRPDLRIYILLWDYAMLYALDRELMPSVNLSWNTPKEISVCLDDVLPAGASHHQKIVVIDDSLAFSGGLDLTIRRWDTPDHKIDNPDRTDPAGEAYRPFHDNQMVVDGPAARMLGDLVRDRWKNAACESLRGSGAGPDLWPEALDADFSDIEVGLARTIPEYDGRPSVREVEALYNRSIEAAESSIYIEAQYLTAESVLNSLTRRMQRNRDLETLIVAPNVHHSWLEERSMNAGRRRFMDHLHGAGVADRVRLLYPAIPEDPTGEGVMVHSKFMIVDDRFLRVGSANLNNRSMGLDTECDLAIEPTSSGDKQKILHIRNRLLAEHLGIELDSVQQAIEKHGGLIGAADALSDSDRSLRLIDLGDVPDHELARTIGNVADPEKPIETPNFVGDLFGVSVDKNVSGRLLKLFGLAIAVIGLVALWRYSPLATFTGPAELVTTLKSFNDILWMPILIPVTFVIGGLVGFPVTVLIVGTGMMFDPVPAFFYALAGSLLSAAATFFIGKSVGRSPLRDLMGPRVNRVSRAIANQGILSVAALRMLPIAPFSIINLVAGASHIKVSDFLAGTFLGMAPGILVISLLGYQLGNTLDDPEPAQLMWLGLGLAGWLLVSFGLQILASRLRGGGNG